MSSFPGALLAFSCGTALLSAAVIQGTVLEDRTGRPLARAQVRLAPARTGGGSGGASALSDRSGRFSFPSLTAGAYILSASRAGFADSRYGRTSPASSGTPIALDTESVFFAEVRMKRLGSISGVVWDENQVGLPQISVYAYRASKPPRVAGSGTTDDRGVFRVPGLPAGRYYVRTGARSLDDGTGLLPTFFPQAAPLQEARVVDVELDHDTPDINISPLFGRLGRLEGSVAAPQFGNQPIQATVTLFSDTGRSSVYVDPRGEFQVDQLAPGIYELLAEASIRGMPLADFQAIQVADRPAMAGLRLFESPRISLEIIDQDGKPVGADRLVVTARRKEPAGEGAPQNLRPEGSQLAPGNWEVSITTPPDLYLVSLSAGEPIWRPKDSVEDGGWLPAWVPRSKSQSWRIRVSTRPGILRGRVADSAGNPAVGAPVFLLGVSADVRRRAGGVRTVHADQNGEYRFAGLPPGDYRVMSSFEFEAPDADAFQVAQAPTITLTEGAETTQRLSVWPIR